MKQAIELAIRNVRSGQGGPFGALVVKDDALIATGVNTVVGSNDPTAHAEINAIRAACRSLGSFQLIGCEVFTSCEPCPMCLGAIYWARPASFYFSSTRSDAAGAGFDDALIYKQLQLAPEKRSIPGVQLMPQEGLAAFREWQRAPQRQAY
jgi:guanine deaminase